MQELLADSATLDVELTQLILQNEVALELLHHDIQSTKKEWEDGFRTAREQEMKRARPQTSLGLPSLPAVPNDKPASKSKSGENHIDRISGFLELIWYDASQLRLLHVLDSFTLRVASITARKQQACFVIHR